MRGHIGIGGGANIRFERGEGGAQMLKALSRGNPSRASGSNG